MATNNRWFVGLLLMVSSTAVAQEGVMIANPLEIAQVPSVATEVVPVPQPSPIYGKPISTLGVDIRLPEGRLPDSEADALADEPMLAQATPRQWPTQVYHWHAAACRHQPLYYEEINAERYGYSCHWALQPAISTAHFFGTIPAVPYLMAADCPWECQYTLGHYSPGSCPPYRTHWWPCDPLAAAAEAGTIAGLILLIP